MLTRPALPVIVSVAGFVLSSMACGLAQNLEEMVLFRALQGVSGAFISPLSQSFMLDSTKPSRQPTVMAIWSAGMMIGPILGPILGGWISDNYHWGWRTAAAPRGQRSGSGNCAMLASAWASLPDSSAD